MQRKIVNISIYEEKISKVTKMRNINKCRSNIISTEAISLLPPFPPVPNLSLLNLALSCSTLLSSPLPILLCTRLLFFVLCIFCDMLGATVTTSSCKMNNISVTPRMIRYPIIVSMFSANSLLSMQGKKLTKCHKFSLARNLSCVTSPMLILYYQDDVCDRFCTVHCIDIYLILKVNFSNFFIKFVLQFFQ